MKQYKKELSSLTTKRIIGYKALGAELKDAGIAIIAPIPHFVRVAGTEVGRICPVGMLFDSEGKLRFSFMVYNHANWTAVGKMPEGLSLGKRYQRIGPKGKESVLIPRERLQEAVTRIGICIKTNC